MVSGFSELLDRSRVERLLFETFFQLNSIYLAGLELAAAGESLPSREIDSVEA
jgi:hypothetical protein